MYVNFNKSKKGSMMHLSVLQQNSDASQDHFQIFKWTVSSCGATIIWPIQIMH